MKSLLNQIKNGLDQKLYYLSLFVALSIPDICGALESDDGKAERKKYIKWINENLVPLRPDKYGDQFTSEHIYQFRCALLHQARTKHGKSEYTRILFFEPGVETGITGLHSCIVGSKTDAKSLIIDLNQFCNDIIKSTELWLSKNQKDKNYIKNIKRFITRYPKGVKPVFGCPVIG